MKENKQIQSENSSEKKNEKSIGDELIENKAVQIGGATFVAAGAASLGLTTGALGGGALLITLGPIGLAIGGILLVGGIYSTLSKRNNKK